MYKLDIVLFVKETDVHVFDRFSRYIRAIFLYRKMVLK